MSEHKIIIELNTNCLFNRDLTINLITELLNTDFSVYDFEIKSEESGKLKREDDDI